jgi:hypothetical protein
MEPFSPRPQLQHPTIHHAPTSTHAKGMNATESNARRESQDPHVHSTHRVGQMATKYVNMLLALDKISGFHNILASFFVWILLAGFVLFPGTFTSLQNQKVITGSDVGKKVLNTVAHVPL